MECLEKTKGEELKQIMYKWVTEPNYVTLINWDLNVEKNIVVINLYPDLDFELPDYLIHKYTIVCCIFSEHRSNKNK